eukprot:2400164-Alexandrium_andersonii.AAC.1
MSASLVGSEMCIRDSSTILCPHSGGKWKNAFAAAFASALMWPARNVKPVSYTHLTLPTICSV